MIDLTDPDDEVFDAETGWSAAPDHYVVDGKETWDVIRERMIDEGWGEYGLRAACRFLELKYELRRGLKGPAARDDRKASWYAAMRAHIETGSPDPRWYRTGKQ